MLPSEEVYASHLPFFGEQGQRKIAAARFAIVGLGGTGSHVVQQLGYLGARAFSLIDGDRVETRNLNRLVNAFSEDAVAEVSKVDVAARFLRRLDASTQITEVIDTFVSKPGFEAVATSDFVVGCVDKDSARLILNEVCQAFEVPYFDLATEIDPSNTASFGGRMLYSRGGESCLSCMDLLDQNEIREDFASEGERNENATMYGIPRSALGNSGPSVVSLNGILASLTVTEIMMEVTGIRPAARLLTYKGSSGVVLRSKDAPRDGCHYCKPGSVRGRRDSAGIGHWIEEGWGARIR